jgi:hypothetical protein
MFVVTKCFKAPRTRTNSLARTEQWKNDMRFGTWNVRSLQGRRNQVSSGGIREVKVSFNGSTRG